MGTWDRMLMHPPTSIETEISYAKRDLAEARQRGALAVLGAEKSSVIRRLDRKIEELDHALYILRLRTPMKRRA